MHGTRMSSRRWARRGAWSSAECFTRFAARVLAWVPSGARGAGGPGLSTATRGVGMARWRAAAIWDHLAGARRAGGERAFRAAALPRPLARARDWEARRTGKRRGRERDERREHLAELRAGARNHGLQAIARLVDDTRRIAATRLQLRVGALELPHTERLLALIGRGRAAEQHRLFRRVPRRSVPRV